LKFAEWLTVNDLLDDSVGIYILPFQAVSTIIAVGTSHGIVLIFGV
jgi:hypothetical protein